MHLTLEGQTQAKQKLSSSISDPVLGDSGGVHGRPAHGHFTVSLVSTSVPFGKCETVAEKFRALVLGRMFWACMPLIPRRPASAPLSPERFPDGHANRV